LSQSWLSFRG